jgi:S1-C subfamily serine protease
MVLESSTRWPGLRAGDVILAVDGRPVRRDGSTSIALRSVARTVVEIVRAGKRIEVTIER